MSEYRIPYGRQEITEEDIRSVVEVLRSDWLTQGPKIKEFEENFARYAGSKYAVAVANGTAALHLSLLALNIGKDDHVITTPVTFAATANAALYTGARVHFVDIDPETFLMDPNRLEDLLKKYPKAYFKAVLPVDFAGLPADYPGLQTLAEKYGFQIIEDACHAPGATYTDRNGIRYETGNGAHSIATAFSFHPVKHIAAGEGGMITTNDADIYEKLLMLRTHGITKKNLQYRVLKREKQSGWYYEMHHLGYNYRITDIQAALGNSQLKKADERLERRREIARKYKRELAGLPVDFQYIPENRQHAWHLFVILTEKRKELYDYLHKNGILVQVHYIPVHLLDYYTRLGWKKGDFPLAEAYYEKTLSLPMYPSLKEEEQEYVIEKIKDFFQ